MQLHKGVNCNQQQPDLLSLSSQTKGAGQFHDSCGFKKTFKMIQDSVKDLKIFLDKQARSVAACLISCMESMKLFLASFPCRWQPRLLGQGDIRWTVLHYLLMWTARADTFF